MAEDAEKEKRKKRKNGKRQETEGAFKWREAQLESMARRKMQN